MSHVAQGITRRRMLGYLIAAPTLVAAARGQLAATAAAELGVSESALRLSDGVFTAPDGRTRSFGQLARRAAVSQNRAVSPQLKSAASLRVVGREQRRVDAHDIVTGR